MLREIISKKYKEQSVFKPENLLREARRQKGLNLCQIPEVCVLDPDGDIVRYLRKKRKLKRDKCWSCYHTDLYLFKYEGIKYGIVGCVVGASFAVLVAEELFVSGCRLLISMTSAGRIDSSKTEEKFILIEKALRDEGASYHYLKPSVFSYLDKSLFDKIKKSLPIIETGVSWTTDAPFRETRTAIESAIRKGAVAVEMEAAALYAFAKSRNKKVICFAHLTNSLGQSEGDFEKGRENGSIDSLEIINRTVIILEERQFLYPGEESERKSRQKNSGAS